MERPRIVIVDENDTVIGAKMRGTLVRSDIYRVTALWITNSKGQILLAKRHHTKSNHPNKWGPAVAGTVDEGETCEENILKEAEEELGLTNLVLKLGPKLKVDIDQSFFTQWYFLQTNKLIHEFTFPEDEVEEIKWFSTEELKSALEKHPEKFIPRIPMYIKLFSDTK